MVSSKRRGEVTAQTRVRTRQFVLPDRPTHLSPIPPPPSPHPRQLALLVSAAENTAESLSTVKLTWAVDSQLGVSATTATECLKR